MIKKTDNVSQSVETDNFCSKIYHNIVITLKKLSHIEALAGAVLVLVTAIALLWANASFPISYNDFWHTEFGFTLGKLHLTWDFHFWVNDILMTVFFLVAGLEIRHEIHDGALSNLKQATLPIVAAVGGVIAPAIIYLIFNADPIRHYGWAVPTATDIAFALGILALLGKSIPQNVRIVLLSLAIIDDIIAVLIIAVFYSSGLDPSGLVIAIAAVAMIFILQYCAIGSIYAYIFPAMLLWFGFWKFGIHPSLAGVILGLITPVMYKSVKVNEHYKLIAHTTTPLANLQANIQPLVAFFIMPVFALANAGIYFGNVNFTNAGNIFITIGIITGLVIGKPLGIMLTSFIAVKCGICRLPPQVNWSAMMLIGFLAGIGFTMAIFVAMLAFSDPDQLSSAKIGVLIGSAISAIIGLTYGIAYLYWQKKR